MSAEDQVINDELVASVQSLSLGDSPAPDGNAATSEPGKLDDQANGTSDKSNFDIDEPTKGIEAEVADEVAEPFAPQEDLSSLRRPLEERVRSLSRQVASLLNRIYEIEEIRHSSSAVQATAAPLQAPNSTTDIDALLTGLSDRVLLARPQITSLQRDITDTGEGARADALKGDVEDLLEEWKIVEEKQRLLWAEMKEDGWLVRFRTTADQAQAMMDPLEKSYEECSHALEHLYTTTSSRTYDDDRPFQRLQKLAKSHDSMTRTYVPSITKILKLMDKSLSERSLNNGETLRRFSDMSRSWELLRRKLDQLHERLHSALAEDQKGYDDEGGMEYLADEVAPYGPPSTSGSNSRHTRSRESTISHGSYSHPTTNHTFYQSPGTPSARGSRSVNGQSATLSPHTSLRSPETARLLLPPSVRSPPERPRWNAPRGSMPPPASLPTPKAGRPSSATSHNRALSPAPSATSATSTMSRRLSRIPIVSPSSKTQASPARPQPSTGGGHPLPGSPGSRTADSHARTVTEPLNASRNSRPGQDHLVLVRDGLSSPAPSRPRLSTTSSAVNPRVSLGTPTLGGRTRSLSGSTGFASPSGRPSLSRAPPSSFRAAAPIPRETASRAGSRPLSRLSNMSYAQVNAATLEPFVPSRYDLLDQEVQRVIGDTGFSLFVSRLDQAMKRGQRRGENEEWKGEYVFGRGERSSPVKLVQLAGHRPGMERRVKCMVRVGGAWHDLAGVLERRMDEMESF
ncbi:hypothetical protein IAU60_000933 [Kwoniella sp. DSM 27419]